MTIAFRLARLADGGTGVFRGPARAMMLIGLAATTAGAAQGSLPIETLSAIKEAAILVVTSAEDDPGATQRVYEKSVSA